MHKFNATNCIIFTFALKAINSHALVALIVGALVVVGVGAITSCN